MLTFFSASSEYISDANDAANFEAEQLVFILAALVIVIFFVRVFVKNNSSSKEDDIPQLTSPANLNQISYSEASDNDEIIAVISAAVAAISSEEGKTYKISSISARSDSQESRPVWSVAGLLESTRPF